jgi:hypothetical protein
MWNVGLVGSGSETGEQVENIEFSELHSAEFASSVAARRTPGGQVLDSFRHARLWRRTQNEGPDQRYRSSHDSL